MNYLSEIEIKNRLDAMIADNIDKNLVAGVGLMFSAGLRISSLLLIDYTCISSNLVITIKQLKGSNTLYAQPIYYRDVWRKVYENKLSPFSLYDRFFFYRLFKRYDLVLKNGVGRNDSVTHAPRKYLANELYSAENDLQVAKDALGHKSISSTKYYIDSNFRRATLNRGIGNNVSGEISNIVIQKNNIIRIARLPKRSRKPKY